MSENKIVVPPLVISPALPNILEIYLRMQEQMCMG